jgi:integrase
MKLTDAVARTLALPPKASEKTFYSDDLPGFGVRVRSSGTRTWVVMYDALGGATRRMTLGGVGAMSHAKAVSTARDILAQVRLGQDPAAAKAKARDAAHARSSEIIGTILPRYLKLKAAELKPRSYQEVERHLDVHGAPLHKRAVKEVTLHDAATFLAGIADRKGLVARNRTRSSWAAFYRWGLGEGMVESNPFAFTNKAPESDGRKRTPTLGELVEIWHASGDSAYGRVLRLLMLSGSRREEIAGLSWGEIDLKAGLITLPGERTKNGYPHEIAITPPIRTILEAQRRACNGNGRTLVFGRGEGGFQDFSGSKEELDQRITKAREARGLGPMENWVPHDFRRAFSTTMHETLGIAPHVVEACLGHVTHKSGVAGVYNKSLYRDDKRAALERWNAMLMVAVKGGKSAKPAKAVTLRGKR